MLYSVAYTGYRAGELAALTPRCFTLDTDQPIIELDGRFTKNGKTARQPVPAERANTRRDFLAGRPLNEPAWSGKWHTRSAELIQGDARDAGIPLVIDTKDAEHVLDFHSLRGTFATLLDGPNVSSKAR